MSKPQLQLVTDQIIPEGQCLVSYDVSDYGEFEYNEFETLQEAIEFIKNNTADPEFSNPKLFREVPFEISVNVKLL